MKNPTRRFITHAFALALSAHSLTAFAQNAPPIKTQDKPQEKKIERQVWIDGQSGGTFNLPVPEPGNVMFATGNTPHVMSFAGNPQDGFSYSFVASEIGAANKLVKGAPYSAEVVTEFVQTLADGNRIVRRNTASEQRDSQGRTRREQTHAPMGMGDFTGDLPPLKTTIIVDPVEGATYMLDDKNHTARRMRFGVGGSNTTTFTSVNDNVTTNTRTTVVTGTEPPKKITVSGSVLQGSAISKAPPAYPAEAKAAHASGPVQVQVTISETGDVINAEALSGHPLLRDAAVNAARQWKFKPTELGEQPVKVQGTLTFNFTLAGEENNTSAPASGDPAKPMIVTRMRQSANAKTTALGKQMIEGLECEGTKIVETIPAGQFGNERPIEIVIERWFSPALQLTLLSKHNDPRHGETTVRMTNLLRVEPDELLFKVPSDYTIKDGGGPQTFIRTTKPE